MDDKELEAIVSCHAALRDLSNDSQKRIFRYLTDRYNLDELTIPNIGDTSQNKSQTPKTPPKQKQAISNLKAKTTNKRRKKSSSSNESYSLIANLNLVPDDNKSLKDFFSKYNATNNFERNIVILYYLKKVLILENIGVNHIYTCYKHLSLKVPLLNQSLRDTKNRKGWIDTSNTDDLKVTVAGENYVEHEISRAE